MRALTLWQPWAHLVVHGAKRIENRPLTLQNTAQRQIGQQVAIHAGRASAAVVSAAGITVAAAAALLADATATLPRGAIVGVATVRGVHVWPWAELPREQRVWAHGPLLIELDQVRALATPIPCRGFLGFWPVIDPIADQVREQLEVRR